MDPERVPAQPQSETASPVYIPGEDTSRTSQADPFHPSHSDVPPTTARPDTSNLSPSALNILSEPPSTEKLESVQPPLPAAFSGNRGTRIISDNQFRNATTHGIDWIVPTEETTGHTVGDRLLPTLAYARAERDKCALRARWAGHAFNLAVGLQVLLGSLTTSLSALAITGGKSTAVATTVFGALATVVAAYLARERGLNEPDTSIARCKSLEQFIRECEAFNMDHGYTSGNEFDGDLIRFRNRFEELLGKPNSNVLKSPPTNGS